MHIPWYDDGKKMENLICRLSERKSPLVGASYFYLWHLDAHTGRRSRKHAALYRNARVLQLHFGGLFSSTSSSSSTLSSINLALWFNSQHVFALLLFPRGALFLCNRPASLFSRQDSAWPSSFSPIIFRTDGSRRRSPQLRKYYLHYKVGSYYLCSDYNFVFFLGVQKKKGRWNVSFVLQRVTCLVPIKEEE